MKSNTKIEYREYTFNIEKCIPKKFRKGNTRRFI